MTSLAPSQSKSPEAIEEINYLESALNYLQGEVNLTLSKAEINQIIEHAGENHELSIQDLERIVRENRQKEQNPEFNKKEEIDLERQREEVAEKFSDSIENAFETMVVKPAQWIWEKIKSNKILVAGGVLASLVAFTSWGGRLMMIISSLANATGMPILKNVKSKADDLMGKIDDLKKSGQEILDKTDQNWAGKFEKITERFSKNDQKLSDFNNQSNLSIDQVEEQDELNRQTENQIENENQAEIENIEESPEKNEGVRILENAMIKLQEAGYTRKEAEKCILDPLSAEALDIHIDHEILPVVKDGALNFISLAAKTAATGGLYAICDYAKALKTLTEETLKSDYPMATFSRIYATQSIKYGIIIGASRAILSKGSFLYGVFKGLGWPLTVLHYVYKGTGAKALVKTGKFIFKGGKVTYQALDMVGATSVAKNLAKKSPRLARLAPAMNRVWQIWLGFEVGDMIYDHVLNDNDEEFLKLIENHQSIENMSKEERNELRSYVLANEIQKRRKSFQAVGYELDRLDKNEDFKFSKKAKLMLGGDGTEKVFGVNDINPFYDTMLNERTLHEAIMAANKKLKLMGLEVFSQPEFSGNN